jgi:putative transposase
MMKLDDAVTIPPMLRNGTREPDPGRPHESVLEAGGESTEAMLSALLDAEAVRLLRATRFKLPGGSLNAPAVAGGRQPGTDAARVSRPTSKARNLPTDAAIIQRYCRRESSVEETMLEIYHAGGSMREVEKITSALWGASVSPSTVCELNRKIAARIEAWRNRPIHGCHPYVFLSGVDLRRKWRGEAQTISVLVAVGVNAQGFREVLGVAEGAMEENPSWHGFLHSLKQRGLTGVELFVGDWCAGLAKSIAALFPGVAYQRCVLRFHRSVLSLVPLAQLPAVEEMLKAIHASSDGDAARAKAAQVVLRLRKMKLPDVAALVAQDVEQTFPYYSFPPEHRRNLRSNYLLDRIVREIRVRARGVGAFSDGQSAVFLVSARLRFIAATRWAGRYRMDMSPLHGLLDADARAGVAC